MLRFKKILLTDATHTVIFWGTWFGVAQKSWSSWASTAHFETLRRSLHGNLALLRVTMAQRASTDDQRQYYF
ncbi:MAG: hypothetical protein M0R68_03565 [Bacteroidetes bacterium]|nr:hypothetical protein [Bacteroidota bacterium]